MMNYRSIVNREMVVAISDFVWEAGGRARARSGHVTQPYSTTNSAENLFGFFEALHAFQWHDSTKLILYPTRNARYFRVTSTCKVKSLEVHKTRMMSIQVLAR